MKKNTKNNKKFFLLILLSCLIGMILSAYLFNHHIITALVMIVFSAALFIVNCAIDINAVILSRWIIFLAFLKYFLYFSACFGGFYGLFMLVLPK